MKNKLKIFLKSFCRAIIVNRFKLLKRTSVRKISGCPPPPEAVFSLVISNALYRYNNILNS
jgi:Ni,Fe-hydrogenase I small subunit